MKGFSLKIYGPANKPHHNRETMIDKITHLRQLIGQHTSVRSYDCMSFSDLTEGIPLGAISEIFGSGKTELVARFLAEHPEEPVAWAEDKLSLYPCALHQRNVNLEKVLFVEAGEQLFWSLQQLISSRLFKLIVAPQKFKNLKELRKLQLSCEASGCCLLLIANQASSAWPIALKIEVKKGQILKTQSRRGAVSI